MCFKDQGLHLDAEKIGVENNSVCPNCNQTKGRKLTNTLLDYLAYRFFVWGSLNKFEFGAAPLIQYNQRQTTSIIVNGNLSSDIKVFEKYLEIGFFDYGPRAWMWGEIVPLKRLQRSSTRAKIIDRIFESYPIVHISSATKFYRVRANPQNPDNPDQYDSPPIGKSKKGRLNPKSIPVMYGSPDLQVCIHECRVSAEDNVYVATLAPKNKLKLLDLTELLIEPNVTEFESLDLAVHMLFLAGKTAYKITNEIAKAAIERGFDGILYPSYFSLLRIGEMPYQTVLGISHRRIPMLNDSERAKSIPNYALFGRPIETGAVSLLSINKLMISKVEYEYHFGPVLG